MAEREIECDVCGLKIPSEKQAEPGELNLCDECRVDFGKSKVVGCC